MDASVNANGSIYCVLYEDILYIIINEYVYIYIYIHSYLHLYLSTCILIMYECKAFIYLSGRFPTCGYCRLFDFPVQVHRDVCLQCSSTGYVNIWNHLDP